MSGQPAPESPVLAVEPVALPRTGVDDRPEYDEPVVTRRELWAYYSAALLRPCEASDAERAQCTTTATTASARTYSP
jgi:hypothetical protein